MRSSGPVVIGSGCKPFVIADDQECQPGDGGTSDGASVTQDGNV
ncbi:hypothetical protein ACVMHY_006592 [Bradyrhizobium barranii subsp. barranii]